MTDQMDINITTPAILAGISPSSSFEKLDLVKLDLDELNWSMKNHCNDKAWDLHIERAKHNASLWQGLISNVLVYLTGALVATGVKISVIVELNVTNAKVIVEG